MKITSTRRISQIFFFCLFVWFCIVSTVGEEFGQLRGWPVKLFFQLDPLVAIGTILAGHSLYGPLLWSLLTVVLTIIFGRFFCGWVCPLGSLHHFVGNLGKYSKSAKERIELNRYHKAQRIKYYILIFFLFMAAFPSIAASLQVGLLDPISLISRSFNLVLLPIADRAAYITSVAGRFYEGGWVIFGAFIIFVLLNLIIPRFYCRFICPLGALFGLISRFALWRIGKNDNECVSCKLCEKDCEGGCEPAGSIRISECVLCFNCLDECRHNVISYQRQVSQAGEITNPDISRRGFVMSLAGGIFAVPAMRLGGKLRSNWYNRVVRPPGALSEEEFLKRCIKCGECMRVCPTNVIQPGGIEGGLENLWTPVLNNRIGSSGCQYNCVACGQICPTAAIRPVTLSEKHGKGEFEEAGPIKIGTAFVDRSRCLAWAMNRPCIVCEENCPLSPKAIYTREVFETVRDGIFTVEGIDGNEVKLSEGGLIPGKYGTGDYYAVLNVGKPKKIVDNSKNSIELSSDEKIEHKPSEGVTLQIQVRLQRPYVDIEKCIGCGICEHECPVSGKRAIRVSAEGETRSDNRKLFLRS